MDEKKPLTLTLTREEWCNVLQAVASLESTMECIETFVVLSGYSDVKRVKGCMARLAEKIRRVLR